MKDTTLSSEELDDFFLNRIPRPGMHHLEGIYSVVTLFAYIRKKRREKKEQQEKIHQAIEQRKKVEIVKA